MDTLLRSLLDPTDASLKAEVMSHSPTTAVIVDMDHTIVKVLGDRLLPALGYSWPDEVIGQPVEIFLPDGMRESHRGWFDGWMNKPQERSLREAQPMTVQCKDGTTIRVRISLNQLYLENGERLDKSYAGKPFRGGVAYVIVDA
jgi:PAS domain S-box-containing protein